MVVVVVVADAKVSPKFKEQDSTASGRVDSFLRRQEDSPNMVDPVNKAAVERLKKERLKIGLSEKPSECEMR